MPKYRKMLNDWDAPYIQSIIKLVETQSKETIANWCVDYAEAHLLPIYLKSFPEDLRPALAISAARDWLAGKIKLPEAKVAIQDCHAAARDAEGNPTAQAAARAIGQCTSTIHAATHCAGLMLYGALAIAYDELGIDAEWSELLAASEKACGRMEVALREVLVENEQNLAKLNWKC